MYTLNRPEYVQQEVHVLIAVLNIVGIMRIANNLTEVTITVSEACVQKETYGLCQHFYASKNFKF